MSAEYPLSIARELESLTPLLKVSPAGLVAYRRGSIEGTHSSQRNVQLPSSLLDDVTEALLNENIDDVAERVRQQNPDEFTLGATVYGYLFRAGQRRQQ
jgi:hypothetical protein